MSATRRGPFVPGRPRRKRRSFPFKTIGILLGALVVTFAIGYFVAVRVLFPPLPEPENGIAVPSITGMTVADAENQLRQLSLRLVEVTEIAHPDRPAGSIIAQTPLAGQQLRELGAVRVAVSSGPPRVPVPNVIGFNVERALTALAAVGFSAEHQYVEDVQPAGTVVRTLPPGGSEISVPGRVVLIVSSGPPPAPEPDTTLLGVPADSISW